MATQTAAKTVDQTTALRTTQAATLPMVLLGLVSFGVLSACQSLYIDKSIPSPIDQEVYASLGTLQCQPNNTSQNQSRLDALTAQLQQAGVAVKATSRGTDGRMRIQQCGTPDGQVLIFRIASSDVTKAQRLGYVLVDAAVRKVSEQKTSE